MYCTTYCAPYHNTISKKCGCVGSCKRTPPLSHYLYRRREKSVKCKMCGGIPAIRIRAAIDLRLYLESSPPAPSPSLFMYSRKPVFFCHIPRMIQIVMTGTYKARFH
jgi:hypothetical protein